jgi:hypothetical protein
MENRSCSSYYANLPGGPLKVVMYLFGPRSILHSSCDHSVRY